MARWQHIGLIINRLCYDVGCPTCGDRAAVDADAHAQRARRPMTYAEGGDALEHGERHVDDLGGVAQTVLVRQPARHHVTVTDRLHLTQVATGRLRSPATVGNWRRKNARIDQNADRSLLSSNWSRSNASALMSAAIMRRWTKARPCRLASSGN